MNRKILLFAFLFNLVFTDLDSSDYYKDCYYFFEAYKSSICFDLKADESTQTCFYSDNKCTPVYSKCEDYKVNDGQTIDSKKCSSIILPAGKETKICEAQENKCVEVYRKCKDYVVGGADCSNLEADDTNKRCLLFNNKCEAHYKKCEDISNESECNKNLPLKSLYSSEKYSKCSWDKTCKPTKMKCSEYKNYKDYLENLESDFLSCSDLQPDSNSDNKCIFDFNQNCISSLGECQNYNGADEDECKKYKPIDSNQLMRNYKCGLESGKCKPKLKECLEYNAGEDSCPNLSAKNSPKTSCVLDNNNKCVEKYNTCDSYNSVITDENKRKAAECTEIVPEEVESITSPTNIRPINIKCIFENNQCKEKKKVCNDYKTAESCESNSYALDNYPSKICVFKNNECQEQYNTCEDYENSAEETKKKDVCESILENSLTQKCIFSDDGKGVVTCRTKNRSCNEFNLGKLQNVCTQYPQYSKLSALKFNEKCVYNNGFCTQTARNCLEISMDLSKTKKDKEKLCNSGITGKNKICTLNEDETKCIEKENPDCEKCTTQNIGNNNSDNNDNNEQNFGKEIYLNKLLISILCLFL